MAIASKLLAALTLSSVALQASAIAIVAENICPIPYVVPRAFQRDSDPVDEYVSKKVLPREGSAQWISSMLIRTRPNVWTIEPYCLRSMDTLGDLCVFTSEWFGKGRGISFITAPAEAPKVALAKALQNQTLYEWEPWVNPIKDERVEMEAIPNKGFGMRSKRFFNRGDAMQSYTPAISIQDAIMQMKRDTWEQNTILNRGVAQLPEYTRNTFNGLHGQFGGNPVYDKTNTNAFNAAIGKSDEYYWSVYPETSRYNHDCRPNTMYAIDNDSLLHNLRVGRQIFPGEEISLSYLAPNMRTDERKQRMVAQWGFECSCSLCTAPRDVQILSDYRVALIEELEREMNDLTLDRNSSISTAEFLVSLHQQERLDGVIGDAYMYAAFEHSYVGDRRNAQKFAALAMEHMAVWRGITHQYYQAMQRLLINPEGEKSWKFMLNLKAAA